MLTSLEHFTPSIRHAYSRYEHSQRQYIGADVFISWTGKTDQICRMNVQTIEILRIFGGSPGIACWRSYSWEEHFVPLCLFVETSPVNLPVASGNGNIFFTQNRHVQIAKNPRSPQSQTEFQWWYPSRPTSFFATIYLEEFSVSFCMATVFSNTENWMQQ